MKKLKKILSIVVILIIIAGAGFYFLRHPQTTASIQPTEELTRVTVQALQPKTISLTVSAYATTISPKSAALAAKANGVITAINFQAGQQVKKGQILVEIQSNDIQNQISKLKNQALASYDKYQRFKKANIQAPGTIPLSEIQQHKLQYEQDLAAYKAARSDASITSPINGIVSDTNFTVGNSVTEGTVIITVTDPQSLEIKYELPSQYAKQAKVGQPIVFYPDSNAASYNGTVSYVSPQLNPQDFSLNIRAKLHNYKQLQPNIFGKVKQVIDSNHTSLVIPQNLVQTDAAGFYFYTVAANKVTKQYFQAGVTTAQGLVQVKSGIVAGTKIITSDITSLNPGQTVKAQNQ